MTDPKLIAAQAEERFQKGFNCAESTSMALLEGIGIQCSCLPGLATAMGGGVGHSGGICGAITGAAMAIGLASTRLNLKDHGAEKQWANGVAGELIDAFKREHSHLECRKLINIDFRSPDWVEEYRGHGCKQMCDSFVRFAAEWAARRLAAEGL